MATVEPKMFTLRSGSQVIIRSAVAGDAQGTLSLYQSVIEEGRFTLVESDELERDEAQEGKAIQSELDHPGSLRLVAILDDAVVGMLRVRAGDIKRTAHFGDVDSVWVHHQCRGQGIGGALMQVLLDWAESNPKIEKLGLFVFSTSEGAIRLYQRYGFQIEGRAAHDIKFGPGDYADTVIMGKRTVLEA